MNDMDYLVVTLRVPTPEATIYWTDDGSRPTRSSNRYVGPITLPRSRSNVIIRAVTVVGDMEVSDEYWGDFFHKKRRIHPSITPASFDDVENIYPIMLETWKEFIASC